MVTNLVSAWSSAHGGKSRWWETQPRAERCIRRQGRKSRVAAQEVDAGSSAGFRRSPSRIFHHLGDDEGSEGCTTQTARVPVPTIRQGVDPPHNDTPFGSLGGAIKGDDAIYHDEQRSWRWTSQTRSGESTGMHALKSRLETFSLPCMTLPN